MTIETKFNKGDKVLITTDRGIIRVPVTNIEYDGRHVIYTLLLSKASTSMDKDRTDIREEENCFVSIDEIREKYLSV